MIDAGETWTPRPGQRVQIRLSGECPFPTRERPTVGRSVEHWPAMDHLTGTVEGAVTQPDHGHRWLVRLDTPVLVDGDELPFGLFSAWELEPLGWMDA